MLGDLETVDSIGQVPVNVTLLHPTVPSAVDPPARERAGAGLLGSAWIDGIRDVHPSLRDIMARMGHDSPRAALIYQHANREADQGIADAIDRAEKAARRKPSKRKPKRSAEGNEPPAKAS